jgi:light-regulated signal transduction histidine kinase (bacteriophytochrome)
MNKALSALTGAETQKEDPADELREFVYIVSHDLGTPLRGMVEFARLLKTEQPDSLNEDGRLYLSLIVESGEKLQAMLSGLLDYSRLNTRALALAPVNCNHVVEQCRTALKDKMAAAGAELEIAVLPDITANSAQIRQLFLALLDNALTFHPPGQRPRVQVAVEEGVGEWVFAVQDNGIGIAPEFYEKLFRPFKRLHADREFPGVGMGLAMARKILGRHGGRIWISAAPDQGTAFKFTLPHG